MKAFIAIAILLLTAAAIASAQENPEQGTGYPPRGMGYGFVGVGTEGMGLNAGIGGEVRVVNGFGVGAEFGGIGLAAPDNNKTTGLWSLDPVYHYFPRNPREKVAPFFAGGLSEFFGHNTHTEFGVAAPTTRSASTSEADWTSSPPGIPACVSTCATTATAAAFSTGCTRMCSSSALLPSGLQ